MTIRIRKPVCRLVKVRYPLSPPVPVQPQPTPLPLKQASAHVTVMDICCKTVLKHTYYNDQEETLEVAFHLCLGSIEGFIGAFEARLNDKVVQGEIQSKEQAQDTYDDAIAEGSTAALVEKQPDGTFVARLGNLAPGTEAEISVTYYSEVSFTKTGGVRVVIPRVMLPEINVKKDDGTQDSKGIMQSGDTTIQIDLQLPGGVKSVASPTHATKISDDGKLATVLCVREKPLKNDFVLNVEPNEAYLQPRAWIQVKGQRAVAAMTVINPYTLFSEALKCPMKREVLFIVDCSGSMRKHGRIQQARDAMQVFLRALPEGVMFNILAFGSDYVTQWNESKQYNDQTLADATKYIDTIQANLGMTKLAKPLYYLVTKFKRGTSASPSRQKTPTPKTFRDIFILTDGFVDSPPDVFSAIKKLSTELNSRIFSLGLGSGASYAQVRTMARMGNGTAEFASDDGGGLTAKIQSQLQLAQLPSLTNASMRWSLPENQITVPHDTSNPSFMGKPLIGQCLLYNVFEHQPKDGVTDAADTHLPLTEAIQKDLICQLTANGPPPDLQNLDWVVPFAGPAVLTTEDDVISRLIAWRLCNKLEEYLSPQIQDAKFLPPQDKTKEQLLKLALQFRIATEVTSFVAVGDAPEDAATGAVKVIDMQPRPPSPAGVVRPHPKPFRDYMVPSGAGRRLRAMKKCDVAVNTSSRGRGGGGPRESASGLVAKSKMKKMKPSARSASLMGEPQQMQQQLLSQIQCEAEEECPMDDLDVEHCLASASAPPPSAPAHYAPKATLTVLSIAMQQKASGCWPMTATFAALLKTTVEELCNKIPPELEKDCWSTLLALSVLSTHLEDQESEWEMLAAKATKWLENKGVDVDMLQPTADEIVSGLGI